MGRKRKRPSGEVAGKSPRKRPKKTPEVKHHPSPCALHHPVISSYYPQVVSLRTFLLSSLPSSSKSRRRKVVSIDNNELAHLLDSTLIGILKQPDEATTQARQRDLAFFTQSQSQSQSRSSLALDSTDTGTTCPQSEIVDFVILTLFNRPTNGSSNNNYSFDNKPKHLLCHGFQRAGPRLEYEAMAGNIQGVVPQYPNQNVSQLRSGVWADVLGLLGKSGEQIMMRLFLDCGIFVSVNEIKGNYYQLSGVPLSELEVVDTAQSKGGQENTGKPGAVLHTPGNVIFVRRRMLYSRAVLNAKGKVLFGLKHKHVLNRCPDSSNLSQTVHLMKYIFPRQFGIHNVFTSRVDSRETVQPFKDYTVREDEIETVKRAARVKKGLDLTTKLPKRLRGELVSLIQKLQKRHTRCAYNELLKYYCPIEKTPTASIQTSLTEFATSNSDVSAFCRAILLKLIPNELYGIGEDAVFNRQHILKFVDTFIQMRRFESLSLHQIVQKMKMACIKWLEPSSCSGEKIALSDFQKRSEIFHELVYYIFDSILIPLIRSNFYVTESNVHRNRLFYFRHDVWRKVSEPTLTELKTSVFEELGSNDNAKRILNQRSLGFSQLRLLPKTTGARPITNLRRRTIIKNDSKGKRMLAPSINSLLTPVFSMLGYEKEQQPEKLGSAIFSVRDIYPKLRDFRQKLSDKPLFFVKLDIKSCFDTIPQHKLVQLMERLISEDDYRVTKHVEINRRKGGDKPARKFVTKARGATDFTNSFKAASNSGTVFVDTAMRKRHSADDLLYLLEEHVRMNLVRIGKKYYRQKNGIPQGSILSSILCNFFYGELESEVLAFLHQHHESLLLRLIDDFLLITTDYSRATRFLNLMISGQPDYGITVNPQKSLVNFPITINNIPIPRSTILFPYCGTLINTHTLEISREDRPLATSDTLTISASQSPGHSFHRKSLSSFKLMSSNPMFLDTSHNSQKVVMRAIYGNFLSAAMRMERYLKELRRSHGSVVRSSLVMKTIGDVMELGVRVVRGKKGGRGFECSVADSQIKWLAVRAFGSVFGRKQTGYREVLGWLEGVERDVGRSGGSIKGLLSN